MVTLCIGRVVLLKKNYNCAGNETKQCMVQRVMMALEYLHAYMAKLILIKITFNCLQYDYNTIEERRVSTFFKA